jgi:hypothetical protein
MINSSRSRGLFLLQNFRLSSLDFRFAQVPTAGLNHAKNEFWRDVRLTQLSSKNYLCIINTRFYAVLDRNQEY